MLARRGELASAVTASRHSKKRQRGGPPPVESPRCGAERQQRWRSNPPCSRARGPRRRLGRPAGG
eukprot:14436558-Alexandrium_andersonii.AAC.1